MQTISVNGIVTKPKLKCLVIRIINGILDPATNTPKNNWSLILLIAFKTVENIVLNIIIITEIAVASVNTQGAFGLSLPNQRSKNQSEIKTKQDATRQPNNQSVTKLKTAFLIHAELFICDASVIRDQ